jgi:hypothetical protein
MYLLIVFFLICVNNNNSFSYFNSEFMYLLIVFVLNMDSLNFLI